jgi:hypothetical protein
VFQKRLHELGVGAALKKDRGARMTKVVKGNVRQFGTL